MGEPAVCGLCVTISDLSVCGLCVTISDLREPLVVDSRTFLLDPTKPPTLCMTRQPGFQ